MGPVSTILYITFNIKFIVSDVLRSHSARSLLSSEIAVIFRVIASVSAVVFVVSSCSVVSKCIGLITSATPLSSSSLSAFSVAFFESHLVPLGDLRVRDFCPFSSLRSPSSVRRPLFLAPVDDRPSSVSSETHLLRPLRQRSQDRILLPVFAVITQVLLDVRHAWHAGMSR